jgi:ABC-type dipeptide/oligopeptide/nickel transport system ATPase component
VPSPANPPRACRFHTRCPKAQELCALQAPPLEAKDPSRPEALAACHFPLTEQEVRERLPAALA